MDSTICVIKARITKNGIDYASSVLHQSLLDDLRKLKIGDHSGKNHGAKWEIKSIENKECGIKHCSIAFSPGDSGLTWLLDGVFLKLKGKWKVKYRQGIFNISDHGEATVKVKGLRLEVHIKLGVDKNGRPTMMMTKCDIHIHDVDFKFHGGVAFVYNIFRNFCGEALKKTLRDKLYPLIERFVNQDGPKALNKLKLSVRIDKNFTLDYGLTQAPTVKADCLDTELKGKVRWHGDMSEAPFVPKAMPSFKDKAKMFYLELPEHIANSMGFLGHKNGSFQYNHFFADISLELKINAISPPHMTITKEMVKINISTNVSGLLSILPLPTVKMDLSLSIQPLIVDEKLKGKLLDQSLQFEQLGTVIAAIPGLEKGLTSFVMEKISKILEKGVDLPVTGALKFVNPSLQLMEGAILIGTDVQVI